jgi:hypothetical protein
MRILVSFRFPHPVAALIFATAAVAGNSILILREYKFHELPAMQREDRGGQNTVVPTISGGPRMATVTHVE